MSFHLEIADEELVALTDLPGRLPRRGGKKLNYSTLYRWVTKGARGAVLKSWFIGGVRFTSGAALREFFDARAEAAAATARQALLRDILYGDEES